MNEKPRAPGPPGYGGSTEGTVGEQSVPSENNPGYDGGPEGKSELANPPGLLEKPFDEEHVADTETPEPIGVPVDQTE